MVVLVSLLAVMCRAGVVGGIDDEIALVELALAPGLLHAYVGRVAPTLAFANMAPAVRRFARLIEPGPKAMRLMLA